MTKNKAISIAWKIWYYWYFVFVVVVGLFIFKFIWEVSSNNLKLEQTAQLVRTEQARDLSDILNYNIIFPVKETYWLWDVIKYKSDRFIYDFWKDPQRELQYVGWLDIMYCDIFDWEGMWRTKYEAEWKQFNPQYWDLITNAWERKSWTPQSPIGKYIPARCRLLSKVQICYTYEWKSICRRQVLTSYEVNITN